MHLPRPSTHTPPRPQATGSQHSKVTMSNHHPLHQDDQDTHDQKNHSSQFIDAQKSNCAPHTAAPLALAQPHAQTSNQPLHTHSPNNRHEPTRSSLAHLLLRSPVRQRRQGAMMGGGDDDHTSPDTQPPRTTHHPPESQSLAMNQHPPS